jgi:hypothetical protein
MSDRKEGFLTRAARLVDGAIDTAVEAGKGAYDHATKVLSSEPFWRPIDTAERLEGQEIFALDEFREEVWIVSWREYTKSWQIKALPGRDPVTNFTPTHWAAIPRNV